MTCWSIATTNVTPIERFFVVFSAKSHSLASLRSSYFFRVAANFSSQVHAISSIVKAFGWREAVPIYVDNEYGEGVIPYLTDALQQVDARVPYRSVISPTASDDQIERELYKLMIMQTRVFIVHMLPELGPRLFAKAYEIRMMDKEYVWILTDGMPDFLANINSTVMYTMQGVLGVKTYVPKTKELENFTALWKTKFRLENPDVFINDQLIMFGLWAYNASFALAMAVEEINSANFSFQKMNSSGNISTDLESFGLSQSGLELVQALLSTRFRGILGEIRLINGQLQTSTYEIVNVNGNRERKVGFWIAKNGLVRTLETRNFNKYSTSNTSLGPIIWPGDLTFVPKGWQIPTNGKGLRIGVPVKTGFQEFVNVTLPFSNNDTIGYSIDVLKALTYSFPFEFIPFATFDGKAAGTYNDLVL